MKWRKQAGESPREARERLLDELGSEASFKERLAAVDLGDCIAPLEAVTLSSIRLRSEAADEANISAGQTKLGGSPDLMPSFDWPRFRGLPLSFIAQINLAEVHPYDSEGLLPATGLLSFFYDSGQSIWGFDPADKGGWAVFFTDNLNEIARISAPDDLPEEGRYRARLLRPSQEPTHPSWESSDFERLGLDDDQELAYSQALDREMENDGLIHRMLGHPDPIQGDMQVECQLASHGLYCGDASGYNHPRAAELRAGATEWRLLLQIDSDDGAEMMWGDVGRIYYWIHRDTLAARDWQSVWLILQCS